MTDVPRPCQLKMMERRQRAAERRGWETALAIDDDAPLTSEGMLEEDLDVILFYKYVAVIDVGTTPYFVAKYIVAKSFVCNHQI